MKGMESPLKARNLCDLFLNQADRFGDRVFLKVKFKASQGSRDFQTLTFREAAHEARELAAGLICLGLKAGDRVAIFSPNRPHWVIADQAIQMSGGIGVPLYPTQTPRQVAARIRDCQARFALTGSVDHLRIMNAVAKDVPQLTRIVSLDNLPERSDGRMISCGEVQEMGRDLTDPAELDRRIRGIREIDPISIVYTPGTCGEPKGVVLTQANLLANLHQVLKTPFFSLVSKRGLSLSNLCHLPLGQVSGRLFDYYLPLALGGEINFAESLASLPEDIMGIRPQVINSIPDFFAQIFEILQIEIEVLDAGTRAELDKARSTLTEFGKALEAGRPLPLGLARDYPRAFRFVQEKIRSRLGLDRWVLGVCMGGKLDREVETFLRSLGILVAESYSLTETGAALTGNFLDFKNRERPGFRGPALITSLFHHLVERPAEGLVPFGSGLNLFELLADNYLLLPQVEMRAGSAGRPLPGTEIRIAGDGEIQARGHQVFNPRYGYWARAENAQGFFTPDGWFRTGDLGEMDAEGYLQVSGRREEIFATSGGKKIAPVPIEQALRHGAFISEAVLVGGNRRFVSALIVPDFHQLKRWADDHDIEFGRPEEVAGSDWARDLIREQVESHNRELPGFEKIKKFQLLPHPFSEVGGEMTPTLKLKRRFIAEKYRELIEEMYKE